MSLYEAQIGADDAGRRLESVLKGRLGLPRGAAQRKLRQGDVRIDRQRVKDPGFRLAAGQLLQVYGVEGGAGPGGEGGAGGPSGSRGRGAHGAPRVSAATAARLERLVVYRDQDLVVIDKPAGAVVHGGTGHAAGLIDEMVAWLGGTAAAQAADDAEAQAADDAGDAAEVDAAEADAAEADAAEVDAAEADAADDPPPPQRRGAGSPTTTAQGPVLAHRLDRETSGLLVLCTSGLAAREVSAALRRRSVDKRYLALVKGVPGEAEGRIEVPLRRDHEDTVTTGPLDPLGQASASRFRVLEAGRLAGQPAALVELRPETGRRHQLRVHMAWLGHPIAGDDQYGDGTWNERLRREAGLKRLALHAASLRFAHPRTRGPLELAAPWPETLARVWPLPAALPGDPAAAGGHAGA